MIRTCELGRYEKPLSYNGSQPMLVVVRFAPIQNHTDQCHIEDWAYGFDGKSVIEDLMVRDLWELYGSINPSSRLGTRYDDVAERLLFARRPFHVGMVGANVSGGAWVDSVTGPAKDASFHIFVADRYGGTEVSDFLMECFEKDAVGVYGSLACGFGPRAACNPAQFFRRHDYVVRGSDEKGWLALKMLRDPNAAMSLPASSSGTSSAQV